jgi:two-component system, NtrC family, sensor kinase
VGQIQVRKELAPDLGRILGNANQIQQIVINLAGNAMDAMGQNGQLTIRTETQTDHFGTWICLLVADTGPGIPSNVIPRIFEPFFTTKPVGKGTGLGLALVHEIVCKHSGLIDVRSEPGNTVFRVRFPYQQERRSPVPVSSRQEV